jgi:hypothetical protein
MNRTVSIEILVDKSAAEALADVDQRARIGRLVSQVARLHKGPDLLAAILERTSGAAQMSGLADEEIDAELTAYNAERRR